MRILLVEDHEPNAQVFVRWLAEAGYPDVRVRQTGLDGLRAAWEQPFEAYVVDLDLPDIDGLQVGLALARHMRAGHIPAVPLIALMARTDTATREEAACLGFDVMVCKPCTAPDLIEAVQQSLVSVQTRVIRCSPH